MCLCGNVQNVFITTCGQEIPQHDEYSHQNSVLTKQNIYLIENESQVREKFGINNAAMVTVEERLGNEFKSTYLPKTTFICR